jgi:hypothetical protein
MTKTIEERIECSFEMEWVVRRLGWIIYIRGMKEHATDFVAYRDATRGCIAQAVKLRYAPRHQILRHPPQRHS